MAKNSNIEWCHHTFNPWVGCTKVSPACDHCYAEGWAKRSGMVQWGPHAERRRTTESNWRQPVKWNAEAERLGVRYRVFCASLADVFDNAVPMQWRIALMKLICETPNLDWLLLTKRIGNASEMLETAFRAVHHQREGWADNTLPNVWIGATICNQEEADRDIPKLLLVPAEKRFLSIEPLLGSVDLANAGAVWSDMNGCVRPEYQHFRKHIDWVIVGGESGPNARPMHPDWARSLRDQCQAAGVPFLFKQWGEWAPFVNEDHYTHGGNEKQPHAWVDAITGDHGLCWPIDDDGVWSNHTGNPRFSDDTYDGLSIHHAVAIMGKFGKKAAGRLLDGRTWDEVPA